ncbi:MAG TPA: hypothetical protein DFS52_16050 [Myxococcales bacterium]|nr:hypothetical protein [Myxococcales bacterium]
MDDQERGVAPLELHDLAPRTCRVRYLIEIRGLARRRVKVRPGETAYVEVEPSPARRVAVHRRRSRQPRSR